MNQMTREQILASIEPKSDQWNYDDLAGRSVMFKVAGVSAGPKDQPVQIRLDGERRFYRPCKSMRRVLIYCWGDDGHKWVGRSMTLYGDPTVMYGGVAVGGIRISHLSHIEKPIQLALTTTRSKRKPYRVEPIRTESTGTNDEPASAGTSPEDTPEGGNSSDAHADPSGPPEYYVPWTKDMTSLTGWIAGVEQALNEATDPFEAWQQNLTTFTALTNVAKTEQGKAALQALQNYAKAKIKAIEQAKLLSAG